jgi:selenide,water dikinase
MTHLAEILKGGAEKVIEAGADLAGGHSIDDKEPKYGLAVTGVARPDQIVYNAGAQPGDTLVLTKRLGIGVLASALKNGVISEDEMMPAIEEAAALNARAAAVMTAVGVHACTDVSGFGLLGHLGEMLDASAVGATVRLTDVPLHDRVLELIRQSVYAGGLRSNRDFLLPRLSGAVTNGAPAGEDPRVLALFDPQTSGGLLMAVAPEKHAFLVEELEENGVGAWTVGEVTGAAGPAAGATAAAAGAICLEG